jgi:hypothetical protein
MMSSSSHAREFHSVPDVIVITRVDVGSARVDAITLAAKNIFITNSPGMRARLSRETTSPTSSRELRRHAGGAW